MGGFLFVWFWFFPAVLYCFVHYLTLLFFLLSLCLKKKNYPQCLCHDHLVTIQIDAVFVSETGLNVVL